MNDRQGENDTSLQKFQQGLNDLLETMWNRIGAHHEAVSGRAFVPQAEQSESGGDLEITLDLPGVREEDLEITAGADRVTVRGERKEIRDRQEAQYHISERSYGVFRRVFELPVDFDGSRSKATLEHGVLTINVPKKAGWEKSQKKIAISPGPAAAPKVDAKTGKASGTARKK